MNVSSSVIPQDRIYIEGLKINAKIGVYEWEKKVEQILFVDLQLAIDLAAAGQSDDLADTLDYAAIAERVQSLAVTKHYQLIEHYAEMLAATMFDMPQVAQVIVTIHKPAAIPTALKVGVQITRTR
jgi:dihydroneopterin aldolase